MARDPATAPAGTSIITPRRRTNHGEDSGARPTSAETAGAAGTATTMPLHSESSSAAAAATGASSPVAGATQTVAAPPLLVVCVEINQ